MPPSAKRRPAAAAAPQATVFNTSQLSRFDRERRRRLGVELLGGVDEAGRGALAGPVVSACVVLEPGTRLGGVNDSKVLTPEDRERLVPQIMERAAAWSVGWASAAEVDRINILEATLLAADRALRALGDRTPQHMITDFLKLRWAPCPVEPIVDGDARSLAVAAASILAKVARDRIMTALCAEYPCYGFSRHKGYGTRAHWRALDSHGPSTLHRLSYNGVCFFNASPDVRSRRRRCLESIPSEPQPPDWLEVLTSPPDQLDPLPFLPEAEWELSVSHASETSLVPRMKIRVSEGT